MRQISAGLMVLPFLTGIGVTIGVSDDLLYPPGDYERLVTARVGAWLAGVALVVFLGLEAFRADRRGMSGLVLAATTAGVAVAIAHDIRAGVGLSPVVVFFIPAVIFAMANLVSFAPDGNRKLLMAARRKLAVVGCATGFVAAYMYFITGTRGLVVDFVMLGAAVACGIALLVCALVVWPGERESAALVTVVAVAIGLITLRDYFIWQAAVLGGSAYMSHRLARSAVASTASADVPMPPTTNSPVHNSG
ncbi:MAG TPA: hypothetical protein VEN31_10090 [Candidatus Bathyarchaeia archaeon]|nr:hypothetical protein [Candidatus Bathyarchaeia archaeon]